MSAVPWLVGGGCAAFFVWLFWHRRPPPVVGNVLPFHDPKKRCRFVSRRP